YDASTIGSFTCYLDDALPIFRGSLANLLAGIPLSYLYQHAPAILIQLELDIVMGRLHKTLHIRYRRQHLLTIRLGRALVLQQLRSEEHTSELQSRENLVCRLL